MVSFRILCSDPFLDRDCFGVMEPFMMLDTAVWIAGAIYPSAAIHSERRGRGLTLPRAGVCDSGVDIVDEHLLINGGLGKCQD